MKSAKGGKEKPGQHELDKEIGRIRNMQKSEAASALLDYAEHLYLTGHSPRRQVFYLQKLRKLEENVGIIPLTPQRAKYAVRWVLNQGYENWTVNGYKITLSQYWQYATNETMPAEVADILKSHKERNHKLKANDLITPQDLDKILENCINNRDKAIFTFLYDSGLRHGELLNLRVRDISFDKYGAKVIVPEEGKTGTRMVRISIKDRSLPFLHQWIRERPKANDGSAYLFCKIEQNTTGNKIGYQDLNRILAAILRRGNIEKRIYPHLFRHTRATILASKVAQRPLEMQMGWVAGSSMLGTYAHLDESAQDEAILAAYGITKDESHTIDTNSPIMCPKCGEINDYKSRFCNRCGLILNDKEADLAKQAVMKIESEIMDSSLIDGLVKRLISRSSDKEASIATLLEEIEQNPTMRDQFVKQHHERRINKQKEGTEGN